MTLRVTYLTLRCYQEGKTLCEAGGVCYNIR
jgi:hypothetical protein